MILSLEVDFYKSEEVPGHIQEEHITAAAAEAARQMQVSAPLSVDGSIEFRLEVSGYVSAVTVFRSE